MTCRVTCARRRIEALGSACRLSRRGYEGRCARGEGEARPPATANPLAARQAGEEDRLRSARGGRLESAEVARPESPGRGLLRPGTAADTMPRKLSVDGLPRRPNGRTTNRSLILLVEPAQFRSLRCEPRE